MIRYAAATKGLIERLIDAHAPEWRAKAAERYSASLRAQKFLDEPPIWGEIKLVFMELQDYKCAYCERPLARKRVGKIEFDVEHFRPKNPVKAWPSGRRKTVATNYAFSTGGASTSGYYWLAHDIENYAASCKPCNTILKSNYFPIAGIRGKVAADVRSLNRSELPFLVYPLGDVDDDPSELIIFDGILAVPKEASGHKHDRGRVTIDFFELNDREELWHDRCRTIHTLFLAMEVLNTTNDAAKRAASQLAIDQAISDAGPQASCARSYLIVMQTDPARAWQIFNAAVRYLSANRS